MDPQHRGDSSPVGRCDHCNTSLAIYCPSVLLVTGLPDSPTGTQSTIASPLPSNLKTQAQLSVDKPASQLTESNKSYDQVNTVSFYQFSQPALPPYSVFAAATKIDSFCYFFVICVSTLRFAPLVNSILPRMKFSFLWDSYSQNRNKIHFKKFYKFIVFYVLSSNFLNQNTWTASIKPKSLISSEFFSLWIHN
jgi:hypothetical protein